MPRATYLCALVTTCGLLAGCQTAAIYPSVATAHIAGVAVTSSAREGTASLATEVRESVLRRAALLPRAGRPKCLAIEIRDFHVKNPVMSLLVGDSNRMTGTMRVIDQASRTVEAQTPVSAQNTFLINGIIGAAHAASQDPGLVQRQLANDFGQRVVERLYGQDKVRNQPRPTPVAASVIPPAEPAAITEPAC